MMDEKARLLKQQVADAAAEAGWPKLGRAVRIALGTSYTTEQLLVLRYGPGAVESKEMVDRNRVLLAELLAGLTDPDTQLLGVVTEAVRGA